MTVEKAFAEPVADPRPPHRTGKQVFPIVAAVIFAISAVLWWLVLRNEQVTTDTTTLVVGAIVLVLAFMGGELYPLQIEVRRETVLVSGSELPMVLGLLLLPAWVVGVTSVVAGAVVFLGRHDSWRNIAVNLSFIAIETGTAAFVMQSIVTPESPIAMRYLGAGVGVLAGALMSALLVGLTYRLLGPAEPLRRVIGRSMLSAAAIVVFGLVGYTVWMSGPAGPWLSIALAVVLVVLYRTYQRFLRQHTDLTRMYTFARLVTGAGTTTDEWRGAVEQVRDQLNAKVGVLRLFDGEAEVRTVAMTAEGEINEPPAAPNDALLASARALGQVRATKDTAYDPSVLSAIDARRASEVMVVPLRSGDRDRGYLEVRDRQSRWGSFGDDDLKMLETLSEHVATALDNLRLLETLRHEAYHDAITGLYNRLGLTVGAQLQVDSGRAIAIVLVELNVLSQVNNALGHDRGEQLLRTAGDRLVQFAGEGKPVARIEGDRFAVLIGDQSEPELTAFGGQLLTVIERPYSLDGIEVDPQPYVGIAGAGRDPHDSLAPITKDPSTLLQRAEMAMLAAQGHQEALQIYRASMGEVYRRRFQLVTQFRQAIEQGRIIVHYQPKIRLADRELVGVESLVRWMHPEFGLVSPAEFVEAIEATGSIDILLGHVLDIVLQQLRDWGDEGLRISAAVNLSVRNLLGEDFPASVARALQRNGVPAELLTFEITESSVMADPEHSLPVLRRLHSMGIGLSVDDFGTGYSSLAYLRRLPIDEIKIDRSFVLGMATDLGDLAIVRAIVDLGHSLGLRVVAEGVEEEGARDALREMKCDQAQGFLISRPMPLDRFQAWLASRTVSIYDPASTTHVLRLMS